MNTSPTISVVMAAYNSNLSYLQPAIASILRQTFTAIECIIIDDGSKEITSQALQAIAKTDARIRLIRNQQNRGLTYSLNQGIKASRGVYIARLDDDDIAAPDRLQKQYDMLLKNQADIMASGYATIDSQGAVITTKPMPNLRHLKRALLKGNPFVHSTLFGTRQVFHQLYDESFIMAQDYEFLLRLVGQKYTLIYDPTILVSHRETIHNLSYKHHYRQELFALKARWYAITRYHYPLGIYILIRSAIAVYIPLSWKKWLIKKRSI